MQTCHSAVLSTVSAAGGVSTLAPSSWRRQRRRLCHPRVRPHTQPLPNDQSFFSPRCNSSGANVSRRNTSDTYYRACRGESNEPTAQGRKRQKGDPPPPPWRVDKDLLLDFLDSGGVRVATLGLLACPPSPPAVGGASLSAAQHRHLSEWRRALRVWRDSCRCHNGPGYKSVVAAVSLRRRHDACTASFVPRWRRQCVCATMLWPRRDRHDGFAAGRGSTTVTPQLLWHYACAFGDATGHSIGGFKSNH